MALLLQEELEAGVEAGAGQALVEAVQHPHTLQSEGHGLHLSAVSVLFYLLLTLTAQDNIYMWKTVKNIFFISVCIHLLFNYRYTYYINSKDDAEAKADCDIGPVAVVEAVARQAAHDGHDEE